MAGIHHDSAQHELESPTVLADYSVKSVKRSACDRCHLQKLSCRRQDINQESCARCVRAGAACVFGPSLRAGGVSKSGKQGGARKKESSRAKAQRPAATATGGTDIPEQLKYRKPLRETSSACSSIDDAATVLEDPNISLQGGDSAFFTAPDWSSWTSPLPSFEFDSSAFDITGLQQEQLPETPSRQGVVSSGFEDQLQSANIFDYVPQTPGEQMSRSIDQTPPSMTTGECIQKLSTLHVRLYEHLRIVSSNVASSDSSTGPTHGSSSSALPSVSRGSSSNFTNPDGIASSELGSIMASSQQLLETLRCLRSNNGNSFSNAEASGRTNSPPESGGVLLSRSRASSTASFSLGSREEVGRIRSMYNESSQQHQPDNATVLLVVSCYMRLLHVYSQLVEQLHQRLRSGLSISLPPYLPNIGSVPLPFTSNLHAVILLQLLAHLLDSGSKSIRGYAEGSMEGVLGARELHDAEWDLRDKLKRCKAELKDSSIL